MRARKVFRFVRVLLLAYWGSFSLRSKGSLKFFLGASGKMRKCKELRSTPLLVYSLRGRERKIYHAFANDLGTRKLGTSRNRGVKGIERRLF